MIDQLNRAWTSFAHVASPALKAALETGRARFNGFQHAFGISPCCKNAVFVKFCLFSALSSVVEHYLHTDAKLISFAVNS